MNINAFLLSLSAMIGLAPVHTKRQGSVRRRSQTGITTPGAFGRKGRGGKRRSYRQIPACFRR